MTTFLDGPAAGQILQLHRVPVMLRVTRSASGQWDALNELEDEARPGEAIFVYRMVGQPGHAFIDYRDKQGRRRGTSCAIASYQFLPEQPGDEHTRDNAAWAAWCDANKESLLAARGQS